MVRRRRRPSREEPDPGQDERLDEGPADERDDRGDIEDRALVGGHAVEREHPDERLDEGLGDVEDELHDVVAGVGDEQQQDDPEDQERLQDAEERR